MVRKQGVGGEPSDERRAVVLMEDLKPQVQLVLEGQTGLVRKLEYLEKRVEEGYSELHKLMVEGFEKVYQDFGRVDERFAKMGDHFTGVHARLDTLTSRFDSHERAHTEFGGHRT